MPVPFTEALWLFGGEGEKDAIVHGDGVSENRRGAGARERDAIGAATERGTRRLGVTGRRVSGLQRDARGFRCAIARAQARVADEDLAITAVSRRIGAGFGLRLRGMRRRFAGGIMARRDGQESDEAA